MRIRLYRSAGQQQCLVRALGLTVGSHNKYKLSWRTQEFSCMLQNFAYFARSSCITIMEERIDLTGIIFGCHETDHVFKINHHPEGQYAVSCSSGCDIKIWDLDDSREVAADSLAKETVRAVDFSACGHFVAAGGDDHLVRLYSFDPLSSKVLRFQSSHSVPDSDIMGLAFHPSLKVLAIANSNNTLELLDIGEPEHALNLREKYNDHTDWLWDVAFNAEGNRILTSGSDNLSILYDFSDEHPATPLMRFNHSNAIWSGGFCPSEEAIITGSTDSLFRKWDLRTGEKVFEGVHKSEVWSARCNPDGRFVATTTSHHGVFAWDLRSDKEPLWNFQPDVEAWHATFSVDGTFLTSAALDGTLWRLDLPNSMHPAFRDYVREYSAEVDWKELFLNRGSYRRTDTVC